MKKFFYITLLIIFISCQRQETVNENILAKVGDKVFTERDLQKSLIDYNNKDSAFLANEIIKDWIIEQLEYNEAIKSLGTENAEIDKLVNEYRTFLYIDKYKKEYIKQNIDTIITKQDVDTFYNQNKDLFILKNTIIKGTYIKVPKKSPKLYKLKKWVKSDKLEDLEQLSGYCVQYAEKYDDFDGNWVDFNNILQNIPKKISNPESFLKYNNTIETKDSLNYYLLYINDYKLVNDTAPVDYIENKIKKLIIEERKKELLISLKNNLFKEAESKKIITFKK